MNSLLILGIVLAAIIIASFWWRDASRRRSLPCPTWLASMLDSRWSDALLGTQATLDHIGLQPGQRVLEIGPGPGRLLIPAAKRVLPGGEVVGLDIQPGMIERLKARAAQAGVSNLTTILGDATQPNVLPESVDVIFLCTVLGEIPDREAALLQCYTALKPGGILSITEIFPDPHYQSRATVQRLAESAGFRLQAIHGPWYFFTANFVKA
ncbi:demethylmenaquinone methyltransferase / 2-methoxy-6-polyprenyl-1,4-benzoquinol methylase [Anaerolineales bacterium]|nr:demethylmenaquinone methyltransferase / 2-methoxy-6-polyprenyl-1,4-benzoquinol methylase [Anaerolineales bacterium]